jgi:hypothetical protein
MTEEYNNVVLVSHNPDNQSNKPLYQEIAKALGSDLVEIVPPLLSKESLEEICEGKPPRVFIHDGTTYRIDPLLKNVRAAPPSEIQNSYVDTSRLSGQPRYPVMIYRGKDIQASDTIRLLNVGFNWIFRDNQTQFTPENVKTIVEKIEE